MLRAIHLVNVVIFAATNRLPVALAGLLLLITFAALGISGAWLVAQDTIAAGFVTGSGPAPEPGQMFVELSYGQDLGQRIIRLASEDADFAQSDPPVWAVAQGTVHKHGAHTVIVVEQLRYIRLGWIVEAIGLIPRVSAPLLLGMAACCILFNALLRAAFSGVAIGAMSLLAAWTAGQLFFAGGASAGSALNSLVMGGFAATFVGTLAFRVAGAYPRGILTRVMAVMAALWVVFLVPDLFQGQPAAPALVALGAFFVPAVLVAAPAAWAAQMGFDLPVGAMVPLIIVAVVMQTVLNRMLAAFEPAEPRRGRARSRPFYAAIAASLKPKTREPAPAQVDRHGRFHWLDLLEGARA